MRRIGIALAVSLCFTPALASAQTKGTAPLPLKRVRLYETGVGYFERTGPVSNDGRGVTLPVPAGHLDDALKTLVVMSKDGKATVSGIEFGSSVSRNMARALAALPNGGDEGVSYQSLLASMKGSSVDVRASGETVHGRLVDVIEPPVKGHQECTERVSSDGNKETACVSRHYSTLLVVTDNNEVRRFRSDDVTSVRPTERGWRARVDSAIDALSQRGARSALEVQATPGQPVTLGYVTETPVWRSTYRLVLDGKGASADRLQGWALLHNDTDESWKQVQVELVNGRPDSFLFPLAAPRYARRELVTPERQLSTVPQLLDKTVDNMWSVDAAGGLGLSGVGQGGGGYGYGVGLGSVGTIGHGAGIAGSAQSSLLAVGNLANLAKAKGVETGALFRYALDKPIDLRAHGSALLPFVNEQVKVTPLTYFEHAGDTARAGVHLKNATKQTFPAGPISIFGDGGFSGETALSRTKPGEERILRFGFDLDLELEPAHGHRRDEPRILRFENDTLIVHFVRHHTTTYNLINRSGRGRKVYLALSYVSNADVKGADSLTFDQERNQAIAVFESAAGKTKRHTLQVREGLSRTEAFKELTANKLRELAKHTGIPTKQRASLRKAADQLEAAAKFRRAIPKRKRTLDRLDEDVEGLRENLRVLQNNDKGTEIMLDRLMKAQQRVANVRREIERLERDADGGVAAMKHTLETLNGVEPQG